MDNFEKGSPVRQIERQDIYNPVNFIGSVDSQLLRVKHIEISKTVETNHLIDLESLFTALSADPFNVNDWKASFTVSFNEPFTLNGVYETSGDFSTELSYYNLIGVAPGEGDFKETSLVTSLFRPTGGGLLGGIEHNSSVKVNGFDNIEWTYKYEENPDATGSDPKYLHDFRITIDSTQILGYVVINADDSESHNFIIDSAEG